MRRNSPAHTDPGPGRIIGVDTMANKTQTIAKTAAKTAPKIVSTNDTARAKAQAANLPATNLQASAKANAAKTAAKTAAKPQAKTEAKTEAKTSGAAVIAMIVEGIAKRIESPFYKTALAYHARNKTVFPRARNNETRAALKAEDVAQVFDMHDKKILASGNAKGQAMFDVYMMQAK